uniref:Tartrate-resistant acid phosphatase type 5 n=1 Tax=Syphacia muris TaxID=451379 RepID=A0A0N5AVE9_9BILA
MLERSRCINDSVCCRTDVNTLKFLFVGDTGGLPIYPYVTYAQKKVAKALAKINYERKTEFLISTGDNIYYTGVDDDNDQRFESSFEDVYNSNKPWYFIAGNHDHFGNISAQVSYTSKSRRWTFPSLYYKISYKFGANNNTLVEFLMIDTIVLCGNTRDIESAGFLKMLFADVFLDPNNPKNPAAAHAQLQWIEQQLKQSKADYLFVVGHYPVYSIASHGPSSCLIKKLKPLLERYNVTAYIAGHDHTLQHIIDKPEVKNQTSSSIMHYIVTGAASRTDTSTKHKNDIPFSSLKFHYPKSFFNLFSQFGFSSGGFVYAALNSDHGLFQFYDGSGSQMYHFVLQPLTKELQVFSKANGSPFS